MTGKRSDTGKASRKTDTEPKRTMAGKAGAGEGRDQGRKKTSASGEESASVVIRPPEKPY